MRFEAAAITALVVSLAALPLLGIRSPLPLEVTYLGNEGFLVRSGSEAMLFDALFGEGLADYDHVPTDAVGNLEAGRPPFADIGLVFISHIHPDHFDLLGTVRFLVSHPQTIVVASSEVSEQLRRALTEKRRDPWQIRAVSAVQGRISNSNQRGVQIGTFPLSHGKVENLAFLVIVNGRAMLHLGDADLPMRDLAQLKLLDYRIDLAFIPFWQLTENAASVRDQIGAKVIVPMHLITRATTTSSKAYLDHIGGFAGMLSNIRSQFPNAVIFHAPLETKTF